MPSRSAIVRADFQNAVMGAGAESLLRHGAFEQPLAIGGKLAEFANRLRRHLRVAVKLFASGGKTRQLDLRARITRSSILAELSGSAVLRISL